jgi:hypothetical protein
MSTRTINLEFTREDLLALQESLTQGPYASPGPVEAALSYLMAYAAFGDFTETTVWLDRGEFVAVYKDHRTGSSFVMGGIWRPELGKFTFHS